MNSKLRQFSIAIACVMAIGFGALLGGGTASAAKQVGDLSQFGHITPYCRATAFGYLGLREAISASPSSATNPYSWLCRAYLNARTKSIDMNAVCRYYYGSGTYAVVTNPNWAWDSWKCYR